MKLKNTFAIGVLVQFYELEMLDEYVHSCVKMLDEVENKENVTFVFCFSTQQYLERIDWKYFSETFNITDVPSYREGEMQSNFQFRIGVNGFYPANLKWQWKTDADPFYNIAAFRREFTWEYTDLADIIVWGESDSMFPSQTLQLLDQLHESVKGSTPKYIANFADRRLWDNSFAPLHPKYENIPFRDDDWQFTSSDSGKGYMTYEQMEEINDIPFDDIKVVAFDHPRFDGSCVAFSSDLLKSGVHIPHALIHHSEDVSIGKIAKKLLGDQFVQYNFSNILHIHNRRHPKKRTGILNENNPTGKCTVEDKGGWWKLLEDSSKQNYNNLFTQQQFIKSEDVIAEIIESTR